MNGTLAAVLPHTALAAREARTHVERLLAERCPPPIIQAASLLTCELVANAVLHGSPPVHLRAKITETVLRVEVHDTGTTTMPTPRHAQPTDSDGRGLAIIEALAAQWGTEPTNRGKCVWFQLAYP